MRYIISSGPLRLRLYSFLAAPSSAFLGFIQMSTAATVGVVVGHMHDGSPRSMANSIALMGILTLLSYVLLLRAKQTVVAD